MKWPREIDTAPYLWFAWYPVRVGYTNVWLERVWRRNYIGGGSTFDFTEPVPVPPKRPEMIPRTPAMAQEKRYGQPSTIRSTRLPGPLDGPITPEKMELFLKREAGLL